MFPACPLSCWLAACPGVEVSGVTMHERNAILYVRSRTPRALRPVTPLPPASPPLGAFRLSLVASGRTPGSPSWLTSGTTISVPVKTHFSPAFARSTISPRRITSIVLGMLPVGISELFSCILTFCQSTNVLCRMSRRHPWRLPHVKLGHWVGSVYLKVCSTLEITVLHPSQMKVAR